MSFYIKFFAVLLMIVGLSILPSVLTAQGYKTLIGYDDLLAEKGSALEDGTGIVVVQPEAPTGPARGSRPYMPNTSDSQFSGKTITDGTGRTSDPSSHATGVGRTFYGNSGMAGGIQSITGYDANDYLGRILGFSSGGDPLAQGFDVGNHSYVGTSLTTADTINLGQRFDFVINRDNTVMVVGANNGSGGSTPDLMATSYNAITVGRTDGNHSRGPTKKYGPGRIKPDIVAPAGTTSGATPIVGAAAALLREAGAGTNFERNEVIKSVLFAGATKREFPDWDRTTTRPIDDIYGYGELNIYNSYHIFEGGEFAASTSDPATDVGLMGWDYGDFDGTNDLYYDFEILAGQTAWEVSASLVWNIEVTDNDSSSAVFDASTMLANLDLELFDSTGTFLGSLVDSSLSTLYNTEHIYQRDLGPGNYTFRVSGDSAVDYGFSWRIGSVPEPGSVVFLGLGFAALAIRRRRVQ
jgi:hypothetical protein